MILTHDLVRRAVKAILMQARERVANNSPRPIWINDPDNEQIGSTIDPNLFFAQLPSTHPSDPVDREEQIMENTIELLMQTGCDWVGWAALTDIAEGKNRTVWLRYRTDRVQPCNHCQEPTESGYVPKWPPLRFVCPSCRDVLRNEEMGIQ